MVLTIVTLFILNFITHVSGDYNIVVQNNVQIVEFGKTAKLSWNAELDDQTVSSVERLFKDNQSGEQLWVSNNPSKNDFAKYFGQRASITKSTEENWKITLTIEKVQPNDTFTFFLLVLFSDKSFKPKENRNASITLQPKGIQKIKDLPSSTNTSSSVSILLNAEPKPTIKWTLNGKTKLGGDLEIKDAKQKQYKFTYQLNTLQAKDCGHNLTYVATGYNGMEIRGTSIVDVIFTPSPITGAQFYQISETVNCQQLEWTAVEAGNCVDGIEYKIAIKNGTDTLTFSTFGDETSLSICNATAAENATVQAVYKGMFGPKSNVTFLEKKRTTTQPPTTAPPPGETDQIIENEDDGNFGTIIGGAVGGIVVLIIIIILVVCILKKKKNQGISNSGEEIHLHQWQQNQKENLYSTTEQARAQPREDPNQAIYSELGPGGRAGPKPVPAASNYAEVKLDEKGYPIAGDPVTPVERTPYDQVRKNSDDDFDHGIIV